MKEIVKMTKSGVMADINNGLTRKAMSEKYGISPQQISKALKQVGLKGVKPKTVKLEIVDDTKDDSIITEDYSNVAQM